MINKNRLIRLTQHLIQINSENPPGDESKIAKFVQDYLKAFGINSKIYEFKKNRSNVVAILRRRNRESLLISPHLDTVPCGNNWKINPFQGKIKGNRIYGLGSTDCKGNLSCALEVLNSLVEEKTKLDYNLIFAATSDEECGSVLGLIPLLDKKIIKPDAAIILDSDEFNIIVTQKGLIHLKVKIRGKRAHGAYPWRGINAIDMGIDIIKDIKAHRFSYRKHKYLRPPTISIGTIRGGDKVNIVADWCEFELDLRFLPGMKAENLLRVLKAIIKKYTKKSRLEIESIQAPYSINEMHPLVIYLKNSLKSVKIKPAIRGSEGATVMSFFQNRNIPAIATGFGSRGCAHIANEYVEIENLYKGAQVLENFLRTFKF